MPSLSVKRRIQQFLPLWWLPTHNAKHGEISTGHKVKGLMEAICYFADRCNPPSNKIPRIQLLLASLVQGFGFGDDENLFRAQLHAGYKFYFRMEDVACKPPNLSCSLQSVFNRSSTVSTHQKEKSTNEHRRRVDT
jgi:hypothetical protein